MMSNVLVRWNKKMFEINAYTKKVRLCVGLFGGKYTSWDNINGWGPKSHHDTLHEAAVYCVRAYAAWLKGISFTWDRVSDRLGERWEMDTDVGLVCAFDCGVFCVTNGTAAGHSCVLLPNTREQAEVEYKNMIDTMENESVRQAPRRISTGFCDFGLWG